ncbi:MAG: dTDP-4-dehydrorhamnose 3,5-epimerase family protein [Candidatus Magasanikbacteria bacterium]|nr:dTDP-4-dehydrorhamnose 3,5-epimerase family protein [Candidatus Magasanikbacteria bacterium]
MIHNHRFHEDDRRRGFYDIIPGLPGDMNITHMPPGVIAGLHMHKKHSDYFAVAKGSVLFRLVYEDGRPEEKIVLSEYSRQTLEIPPGVWHGYKSLEASILVFYTNEKFNPDDEFRRPTNAEEWASQIK